MKASFEKAVAEQSNPLPFFKSRRGAITFGAFQSNIWEKLLQISTGNARSCYCRRNLFQGRF